MKRSIVPAALLSAWLATAGTAVAQPAPAEPAPPPPAAAPSGTDAAPPITDDAAPAEPPPPAEAPPPEAPPSTDAPASATDEELAMLKERLRELEQRFNATERKAALQRLEWSADFRSGVASYRYRGPDPSGARNADGSPVQVRDTNAEQWLQRARFSIKAEPSNALRLRARMTMFKRFGTNTATPFPQDFGESQIPRDSGLRLDRVWLDWFLSSKIALSIGRISYADGPPAELRENLDKPDATWGQQMVNGEYDTVDLTVQAARKVLVRLFYASWAFARNDDLFSSYLFLNSGTDNLRIVGGNVDVHGPDDSGFMLQLGFYYVPKFRPFVIPIPSPNPPPNPSNAPPPFDGSLVFPTALPDSLGSYANASALALVRDAAGSGIDLFAAAAVGFLRPNGEAIGYPIGPNGETVPLLALTGGDFGAKGEPEGQRTLFVYAGARVRLPVARPAIAPKLGVEVNYGSRYLISFAQPGFDLTNKLATRGAAYEAYLIQPISKRLFLKLDYQQLRSSYAGGFFGSPLVDPMTGASSPEATSPAVESTLHAASLLLNATL